MPAAPHALSRRLALQRLASLSAFVAPFSQAAPGGLPDATHTSSSREWEALSSKLFNGRTLVAGQSVVQLQAPLRAAYGASVPVKIVSQIAQNPELRVQKLHIVVDQNPSPLAGVITVGPELNRADFETRLRVDTYSHVRVVAELSNGQLHTDSRFVKTSGGCSAPPNRDSPHLIGKTLLKVDGALRVGEAMPAEVAVLHPNDTGFELNHVTVMYIPPHFVRNIRATYQDRLLFDADMDFSFSENPMLRFQFVPREAGELRAEVVDSRDMHFEGRLRLG